MTNGRMRNFPRDLWNKLGQAGLLCVDIPEKYGGHGADAEMALNIPCGIACVITVLLQLA